MRNAVGKGVHCVQYARIRVFAGSYFSEKDRIYDVIMTSLYSFYRYEQTASPRTFQDGRQGMR